jgi:hypothetical protein
MVDFAWRNLALMRLQFEAGVRFAREHSALAVLAVGRDRQFIEDVRFGFQSRQFLDRGVALALRRLRRCCRRR